MKSTGNIVLYVLHYAGGNKYSFNSFKAICPRNITFSPVELPGRGARSKMSLLRDLDSMTEDLFKQINLNEKYAIWGHSLGALLAYLITKKIQLGNYGNLPSYLIVSGSSAPETRNKDAAIHLLPFEDFLNEIKKYGGMPEEIIAHRDLLEYIEPILRSDFQAAETYVYKKSEPFDVPITVLTGQEDTMSYEDVQYWQNESVRKIEVISFTGDHFFINNHKENIIQIINDRLISI